MTRTASFPLVIVGHVDHGKSTLIGRLLRDTDSLSEGQLQSLEKMSHDRGMTTEWSFLLDAFQAERDQGITIDTTQIRFRTAKRQYVIIDAPGHKEFLKNMITGAASAQAAILVIDAAEGVQEQSRRHAYLLRLLGIAQIAVVVNKIDLVDFDQKSFTAVERDICTYLLSIGVTPSIVLPVSARYGHNISVPSDKMPWYKGPTIVGMLDFFAAPLRPVEAPLRLPVQDVLKLDDRRLVVGHIESGRLQVGDPLHFAPDGQVVRIASIETWNAPPRQHAAAGEPVALTLDGDIFIERGAVASHADRIPGVARDIAVRVFWLGRDPLRLGDRIRIRLGTAVHDVTVHDVTSVLDVETLLHQKADSIPRNAVAEVVLHGRRPIVADLSDVLSGTGRGVILRDYTIVGGFVVSRIGMGQDAPATRDDAHSRRVMPAERSMSSGHTGGVLWLTGLSGVGKSTLATRVERALFGHGWQAFILDSEVVRQTLSQDLGFSPADRRENIRRVAATAQMFADAGFITIVAMISPYRQEREAARAVNPDRFHEVYVKASVEICETRDPKSLYAREIADFTGISAPYEEPEGPALLLDTKVLTEAKAVEVLLAYARQVFASRRS